MKFIGLLLLVLGTRLAFAQEKEPPPPSDLSAHKCVYKNTFSDSARLTLYPFSTYRTVRLVSFRFHPNNLPVGDSKFERDSLVQDVALSKKQLLQLTDILYNNQRRERSLRLNRSVLSNLEMPSCFLTSMKD